MRTLHPLAQPLRLATLDTPAGTSGRNEAEEETDEIFEEKKEIDEDTSEEDEKTDEVKQTTAGPQINFTKRKKQRVVQHSRKKKNEEKKKNMDSTVIQWMSRG